MEPLYITLVMAGLIGGLVGLLYAGKLLGERLHRSVPPAAIDVAPAAPLVADDDGFLSTEEREEAVWLEQGNQYVVDRLEALEKGIHKRLELMLKMAMRELDLDPDERRWVRLHSGEHRHIPDQPCQVIPLPSYGSARRAASTDAQAA
jgi:hypothetical protein